MEKSFKSIAKEYGLYLGAALTLWTVIAYVINLELLVNFWMNLLIIPVAIIAFGVVSTAKSKGILGGYMSFKEAFTSYFITVAIGIVISFVVSFILFNVIDPEAANTLKEITTEKTISMMENFGAPAEKIAEQVEAIENQNIFSLKTQLLQIAQSLVFFTIIGLIVALIMKKNKPETE
ncbi:DUF4199 domain-containing protein [Seonamhaeicola sp. S2-3]|uniref:DUF4199 domain-containing protein n=1 Tax=Seonamhaeicola sp. S2-3 TaxID=1936081 RepID=UPI0009729273|nr:DUF4199 domain-containing protein [Seonamhaeicola sp. S2-3]APY11748.1 DUF4199 domain-containing protein [Seonamhaeicola sp. S2-3]